MMKINPLALTSLQQRVVDERRAAAAALRAPAPAPKKATAPQAPAHKEPAPRTPTAAEREAERAADRKRREREYEKMMEFVRDPSASPFAHLAPYRAPEVELSNAEPFVAGLGTDAAVFEMHVVDPAAMTKEILRCGEMTRGIGPQRPEPTGLAAQIVEAGRKRRGLSDANTPFLHVVADQQQPTVATAEAIIAAGRRRRGEVA
jgi:hypothetical protein